MLDITYVVVVDIGKSRNVESHPFDSLIFESLSRDLDNVILDSRLDGICKVTPYIGGFGSGVGRFKAFNAVICIYRRHKTAFACSGICCISIKNFFKVIRSCRLTLSTRYGKGCKIGLRVAIEHSRNESHRRADVADGNILFSARNDPVADICDRTLLYRGEEIFLLKMNALGNKKRAGSDLSRIEGEVCDLGFRIGIPHIGAHQQAGIIKSFNEFAYSIDLIYHLLYSFLR